MTTIAAVRAEPPHGSWDPEDAASCVSTWLNSAPKWPQPPHYNSSRPGGRLADIYLGASHLETHHKTKKTFQLSGTTPLVTDRVQRWRQNPAAGGALGTSPPGIAHPVQTCPRCVHGVSTVCPVLSTSSVWDAHLQPEDRRGHTAVLSAQALSCQVWQIVLHDVNKTASLKLTLQLSLFWNEEELKSCECRCHLLRQIMWWWEKTSGGVTFTF